MYTKNSIFFSVHGVRLYNSAPPDRTEIASFGWTRVASDPTSPRCPIALCTKTWWEPVTSKLTTKRRKLWSVKRWQRCTSNVNRNWEFPVTWLWFSWWSWWSQLVFGPPTRTRTRTPPVDRYWLGYVPGGLGKSRKLTKNCKICLRHSV